MRAIVVLARDGELAVALRERLDRAYVTVFDTQCADPVTTLQACRPWPWMVVGDVDPVAPAVAAWLRHRPVLVRWLGSVPAGMPAHARTASRFGELVGSVLVALGAEVAGVRLAVGTGVDVGGAVHVNAELEALLCEAPSPLRLPRSRFRSAEALIRRCAPQLRLVSSSRGTAVVAG